jgi:malonyl-CoA/methylmalonyl-CoA synthetase
MIFLPRFDALEVVEQLRGATVLMGVPTFYTRLLREPGLNASACRSMRLFISGSAPLRAETFSAFEARTGHRILERYGMTEAGMITSNPLDGERVPATVGFALPEVQVRVADEHGTMLESDAIGVLEINGPNVFTGYWRMPEKTAEEFRPDGFFVTGDLARIDREGRVTIVGRAKDLIISGGFNVYPKEVEQCLNAIEGVTDSAVFGVPHPDFGEAVVAAVTVTRAAPLSEPELIERLGSELARFKQPKRIVTIDELPRNAMGKVQKNALRTRYAKLFDA